MAWIIIAVALPIVAILLLPFFLKAKINSALQKMNGYTGRIEGLRVNLLGSKLLVTDVTVNKNDVNANDKSVALQIPDLSVSFRWGQLLKRNLDLRIHLNAPKFFITDKKVADSDAVESKVNNIDQSSKLKNLISGMMPFRMDMEIRDARVVYQKISPSLELQLSNMHVSVTDFSNHSHRTSPCVIKINGMLNEGSISTTTKLYPLESTLTFDLISELKSVNMVLFNDLFKTYGKVDINKGTLDLYGEISVADNSFKGFLKPILTDLDFIGVQDKNDSLIHKVWERLVAVGVQFLVNRRDGQLATTIPLEGRLDDPQVDVGVAIAGLVRNAFFKALRPSMKDVVSIESPWRTSQTEKV
jgi:hypothetical protein